MTRLTIAQIQAGFPAPVQNRMYRNVNEQLSNIVVDYDNRVRIDYLRAISYVIWLSACVHVITYIRLLRKYKVSGKATS